MVTWPSWENSPILNTVLSLPPTKLVDEVDGGAIVAVERAGTGCEDDLPVVHELLMRPTTQRESLQGALGGARVAGVACGAHQGIGGDGSPGGAEGIAQRFFEMARRVVRVAQLIAGDAQANVDEAAPLVGRIGQRLGIVLHSLFPGAACEIQFGQPLPGPGRLGVAFEQTLIQMAGAIKLAQVEVGGCQNKLG